MKKTMLRFTPIILVLLLSLGACQSNQQEKTTIQFSAKADGPFFQGPNSLIAEYQTDLTELFNKKDIKLEDVDKIGLVGAKVVLITEEANAQSFNNASLQLVSNDLPMQSLAVANPIKDQEKVINLVTSDEVDLLDFFKGNSFSVITDLDFKEDDYSDQFEAQVEMQLLIEY